MRGLIRWHSYAVHGDRRWIVGSGDVCPEIDGNLAMQKSEGNLRQMLKDQGLDTKTVEEIRFEHEVAPPE